MKWERFNPEALTMILDAGATCLTQMQELDGITDGGTVTKTVSVKDTGQKYEIKVSIHEK